MTRQAKRLQRIRQNPNNVSFDELRLVLEDFGFVLDRSRGSHRSFIGRVAGEKVLLTIPVNHPLKSTYVKQALQLIDIIISESQDGDSENDHQDA